MIGTFEHSKGAGARLYLLLNPRVDGMSIGNRHRASIWKNFTRGQTDRTAQTVTAIVGPLLPLACERRAKFARRRALRALCRMSNGRSRFADVRIQPRTFRAL